MRKLRARLSVCSFSFLIFYPGTWCYASRKYIDLTEDETILPDIKGMSDADMSLCKST